MKVAVYPPDVNLETSRDFQTLIVQVTQPDGITRDVTAEASITSANPQIAAVDKFTCKPVGDGNTELVVTFAGQTQKVPVKVRWGEHDPYIPRWVSGCFHSSDVQIIPGCGHWVQLEAPDAVVGALT